MSEQKHTPEYTSYRNYVHKNAIPYLMVIGPNRLTFDIAIDVASRLESLAGLTDEEVDQVGEWIKSQTKTLVFDYVSKNRILQAENERLKAEIESLK